MRVLFFGRLVEAAGGRALSAPDDIGTLAALRAWLETRDPLLAEALCGKGVRAAVNKVIATDDFMALTAEDEVAFMPPLSGG
ncbi:MAG: MoaD/ThiS family protein [Hyphomonadaceae bacterium]